MVVYVITHKHFNYQKLPKDYIPLLVGAFDKKNKDKFLVDSVGDNISKKNYSYCEETGLYWLWKHAKDNKIGLAHYRRFFSNSTNRKSMYLNLLLKNHASIINVSKLDNLIDSGYQWILSQPEYGGDGSLWNQFKENHNIDDLRITEQVIKKLTPEYGDAFDKVLKQSSTGSFYNMFYTTRDQMNSYCEWLFKILFAVEEKTDISSYNSYQQRLYGFLSERLLNVWMCKENPRVKYLPVYETESMNRNYVINLIRKH